MKRLILLGICILVFYTSHAQCTNLQLLPQKLRDSILIDVANKAIQKYSEGYLRPGLTISIQDLGPLTEAVLGLGERYLGVYFFSVSYRGTERECKFWNSDFLVKAYIRADNGRTVNIRYINDGSVTMSGMDLDEEMQRVPKRKMRFVSVAEREEILRKTQVTPRIISPANDYWKKFDERVRFVRDSVYQANKRKIEERRRADSLRQQK